MSCIRQKLESQGVTGEPLNIILASWRQGTQKQYTTYIKQWLSFCEKGSKNGFQPSLQDILEFLTAQSKRLGYSAVNTARSALSTFITIDGVKAGEHPLISRFMTGVFNQNPALPRYVETWDPQIVVSYLESFPDFGDITLKQLALKLAMLLALTTAQRIQTLKALSIADMEVLPDRYVFRINCLLKQTSSKGNGSRHLPPVVLKEYSQNKKLCVV